MRSSQEKFNFDLNPFIYTDRPKRSNCHFVSNYIYDAFKHCDLFDTMAKISKDCIRYGINLKFDKHSDIDDYAYIRISKYAYKKYHIIVNIVKRTEIVKTFRLNYDEFMAIGFLFAAKNNISIMIIDSIYNKYNNG